jgi:hypothetical protein
MASTYVNDLRLNEMATGDASGSWGTVTNTNLELIGEAFGYGTETIGNADTTITMADGAADAARSFYLKITSSADLTTTRVITLAPNTVSKVWIIENATSGSQIITIKQGTGATINIPNGHVKMVATDGAGSGGAVLDLLTDLNVATNLFVKNAGTGDGSTANIYLQTAEADIAADDVIGKINFQAPNEGTGTDAILVSAAIQATSEGDFSSSSNATSLNFMTGASEAATTKMTLSSAGNLTVTGIVDVTDTTDASDATGDTGALRTEGGASIAKKLYVGTDLDVDGTTNLDVVDIDGAVDMASTLAVAGVVTANAGVVVDNITIDGNEIDVSSGDLTLDVAGSIVFDADSGDVNFKDNGVETLRYSSSASGPQFFSSVSDKDIIFKGNDDGSTITALTLDMSDAGTALFNNDVDIPGNLYTSAGIVHKGDTNTSLDFGTDQQTFYVGGVRALDLSTSGVVFNEGSADLDFRIETNAQASAFVLDAANDTLTITNVPTEITHSGNGYQLRLTSTDADASVGPVLDLYRNSANPADGDRIGSITYRGRNDNSQDVDYIVYDSFITDASDGVESAELDIRTMVAGTETTRILLDPAETVFNEASADLDFRVESNGNANMLFVDGGNDQVSIGGAISETTDTLQVTNAGSSGPTNTRFVNTNADASGVRLDFMKNTSSPADGDGVVQLNFLGKDSSGNAENYANINVYMEDVTSGTEDGSMVFSTIVAGVNRNRMDLLPLETVFNEAGVGGINFRIESDTNANMFLIDSGDNTIAVGTTNTAVATQNTETGVNFTHVGRIFATATDHHDFNMIDDGEIFRFRSATTAEGNISVSGSTVSYNGFSGTHESSGIAKNVAIGTVVSTIDELDVYAADGSPKAGQTRADHAKVKVSDSVGDKRVYGVVTNFNEYDKAIIAAVGIGSVKVTGACVGGDLLESNGDGTAKVQSDDIIRSKTIAKVTIGNSNTGVKLVSCVLYCG